MDTISKTYSNSALSGSSYDASELSTGIVHIGLGAFHRAHQALYTHETIASTGDTHWGICAASIRSGQPLIQILNEQENAYTIVEINGDGSRTAKLVTCTTDTLAAKDDRRPLLEKMSSPDTRIVSLTITEKGYCLNPATEELLVDDELIAHDLAHPEHPKSAQGLIVQALSARKAAGIPPFTVLSCDNVPDNGLRARQAVVQMAGALDEELAQWIETEVAFPCTMVDRIVPAMTDDSFALVHELLGIEDKGAIVCEPFRQWVIEDHFTMGRPDWDKINGVTFVNDVRPYEEMKLRMLNGSHSLLAYLGYLAGYETIDACMTDENFLKMARHFMKEEAATTLNMEQGVDLTDIDLTDYAEQLIQRFQNPGLKHRTWQIAMDGSQKIPQRWLNTLSQLMDQGKPYPILALGIAAWIRYVSGVDEQGNAIDVRDPQTEKLKELARLDKDHPEVVVARFLRNRDVFTPELADNSDFVAAVTQAYQSLIEQGARVTVKTLVETL